MARRNLIRDLMGRLLAIFLIAGLVAAPLVSPAAAKPMSATEMASSDMAAGMPCCPDEPQGNACQDCPLVAICMLKATFSGPLSADAMPLRVPRKTGHAVRNDDPSRGSDQPPPDHPPRILI